MITLLNLTRDVWIFASEDNAGHIVVGDCNDTDEWMKRNNITVRTTDCFNPRVSMTEEDFRLLGVHDRDTIRTLVRDGAFKLEAGELGPHELPQPKSGWDAFERAGA